MKKRPGIFLGIGMLCLSVLLAGCGGAKGSEEEPEKVPAATETASPTPTETQTPTPAPTEEPEPELKTIGTESEHAYKVRLVNLTGIDINSVAIKSTEEEAYSENFLTEGDIYTINEERYLYFEPQTEENAEGTKEDPEDEKALEAAYDVQFSFENGLILVVHSFPFGDVEEAELYAQDSVAFLKYKSKAVGEMVDTKEAELTILAAEQEAAAQEAEAQAAATQSYEEPEYDETYYEEPAYEETYYEEPSYDGGAEDGCLDGGLVY